MTDLLKLENDLKGIRAKRDALKKKRYSRLNAYRPQIEGLSALGASREEIRIWLRQKASVNVAGSTVSRALKRWKDGRG